MADPKPPQRRFLDDGDPPAPTHVEGPPSPERPRPAETGERSPWTEEAS